MKAYSPTEGVEAATINDRVRDMMVIAVPRLLIDEQISLVEPDEFLVDDGAAKLYAKQFEYDDTPRMDVTDEVYDLMCLAVPSIDVPADEITISECYCDLPDDGLECAWIEQPCGLDVLPAAINEVRLIGAPADVRMLPAPAPIASETMSEIADPVVSETPVTEEADEQFQVMSDAPLVMFSFGPSKVPESGWTVCFSF